VEQLLGVGLEPKKKKKKKKKMCFVVAPTMDIFWRIRGRLRQIRIRFGLAIIYITERLKGKN